MAQRTDVRRGDATPAEPKHTPPWALLIVIGVAVAVLAPTVVYLTSREARRAASVNVLETAVEVRRKAQESFQATNGSAQVDVGDVVRTDNTGKAELQYWNGSFTRLAPSSSIEIKDLATTAGRRIGRTRLDEGGRLWNRVSQLTSNRERYEVESPNALAAVRGTGYDVDCTLGASCRYTVVNGEVNVETGADESHIVRANERLTVDENGKAGPIEHVPDAELAKDPWIAENVLRDEELGVAPPGELSDDGSTSTPEPEASASAPPPPPPAGGGGSARTFRPAGGGTQPAARPGPTPRRDPFADPFFANDPGEPRDRDNDEEPTPDPTPEPTPDPTPESPPPVD